MKTFLENDFKKSFILAAKKSYLIFNGEITITDVVINFPVDVTLENVFLAFHKKVTKRLLQFRLYVHLANNCMFKVNNKNNIGKDAKSKIDEEINAGVLIAIF